MKLDEEAAGVGGEGGAMNRLVNEDDPKWRYKVEHFKDGSMVLATVHVTEASMGMEVGCAKEIGRTVKRFIRIEDYPPSLVTARRHARWQEIP